MVAIQSTAEPPPPESPKGPGLQPNFPVAPLCLSPLTMRSRLTTEGRLMAGKGCPKWDLIGTLGLVRLGPRSNWCWRGTPAWHVLTWRGGTWHRHLARTRDVFLTRAGLL